MDNYFEVSVSDVIIKSCIDGNEFVIDSVIRQMLEKGKDMIFLVEYAIDSDKLNDLLERDERGFEITLKSLVVNSDDKREVGKDTVLKNMNLVCDICNKATAEARRRILVFSNNVNANKRVEEIIERNYKNSEGKQTNHNYSHELWCISRGLKDINEMLTLFSKKIEINNK